MTLDPENRSTETNCPAPIAVYLYAGDQIIENVTTVDSTSQPLNSSTHNIRHLFQGQLWTQEPGLNDYRNRVELPTMGVFLQPDPIGFKGDAANVYRFCNNNAVNRIDPMGLYDVIDLTNAAHCYGPPTNPEPPPEILVAGTNITKDVARFEAAMNSAKRHGSKTVNWSVGFEEVWDPKYTFKPGEAAVTNWRVVSTAFEKDGRIVGFHNALFVTIHWNDSACESGKAYARRSIGGEIEHTLDAMRAGYLADGQGHVNFRSAQNIADGTARDLVGRQMSSQAAQNQMESSLRNWEFRSMQDSRAEWDVFGKHIQVDATCH